MSRIRLAALVLVTAALAASGCGGSGKATGQTGSPPSVGSSSAKRSPSPTASSSPTAPLTRAELIAKGDAICWRVNARRVSTKVSSPADYERLVPPLAAYELAAAAEMRRLTPPASMAKAWEQITSATQTIAEVTGTYREYSKASNEKLVHHLDAILATAIHQMVTAAKREGFKNCASFA